jgi:AcrR family transcriptional regulator
MASTQRERSARSKDLVLNATVEVLSERGFGSTTTLQIQQRAGVSRGRMLHHFGSREDLLVAAVQYVAIARLSALPRPSQSANLDQRLQDAIRGLWSTYQGALFWAAMELWLAARTSKRLAASLLREERELGATVESLCDELFGPELATRSTYSDFRDTLITSMRGVALTYAFNRRPTMDSDPHQDLWLRMARQWLGVSAAVH